jgi:tetratricopeptide (TPR) repeat protein
MSVDPNPSYERYIENLVLQRSVSEMRQSVASTDGDLARLDHAFGSLRRAWHESGREAACALLDFVRFQVAGLLPQAERPPGEIVDRAGLLQAAMSAPGALRARSLLKRHRGLVDPELLRMAEATILTEKGRPSMAVIGRTISLIAVLLDDPKARVKGLLIWKGVCQKEHRFEAAERHLKRAARLAADMGDPSTALLVTAARAGFYRDLRRIREAIEVLEEGVKESGADRVELISLYTALSSCYRESSQPTRALDALTQLISLLGDDFPEKKYDALDLSGLVLEDLGKYDKGAIYYEAALTVARDMGDRGRQFVAMNNRAASFLKRGLVREGLSAFRRVLRTVENWGHPPMIASAHNNVGHALCDMERFAEARSEFRKALPSKLATGDLNGQFICFQGMGDASRGMDDFEAAKLDYAMALVTALESRDGSLVASVTMRTSDKRFWSAESVDETIASLRWARDICRTQAHPLHELLLTSHLTECLVEAGRRPEALVECAQFLNSATLDPDSPEMLRVFIPYATLTAAEPGGWRRGFDLLLERAKKVDRAMEEALIGARRAEIVSKSFDVYAALIELLTLPESRQALTAGPSPAELAFDLHEAAKSRSYLAILAGAPLKPPESIPEALRVAETALLEIERSLQEEGETRSEAYRLEKLGESRNSLRECWEKMKAFAPAYVRFRSGTPYTFREMTALLPKAPGYDTVYASLFVDKRFTTCFVFRPGANAPELIRIELGRDDLAQIAKRLRRAFNGAPEEFPPYPPIRGDLPGRRSLEFLGPLSIAMTGFMKAVNGADLIVVAPHGPLHLIPLQVLRCPDGKYLAEKSAVAYSPSLSTGIQAFLRPRDAADSAAKASVFAAGVSSVDDAHPEYFENDVRIFDNDQWDVTAAFGVKQATRNAILSNLAGKSVVHLSCHGFFDNRNPLNSGLVFSDGKAKAPRDLRDIPFQQRQDYLITVQDLMQSSLTADLVTLSACSSGLQNVRNAGDEVEGLSRTLLAAGASAALVAMWNVDQSSSQNFLANFYSHLANDRNAPCKWRALHNAQLSYILSDDEKLRHPYHWAPFALIGDWR